MQSDCTKGLALPCSVGVSFYLTNNQKGTVLDSVALQFILDKCSRLASPTYVNQHIEIVFLLLASLAASLIFPRILICLGAI